ncbi:MAG: DUF1329 domain-containing protein [Candidatus Binataceae bacterium]
MRCLSVLALAVLMSAAFAPAADAASVKPGDVITPDNASAVADLVSPGNLVLVKQGMRMTIVPTDRLEWPPPYKVATEKYAPQVRLSDQGFLENYVAGLPFPLLDPNDPQIATKVIWNFSYKPIATDDVDIRNVETVSHHEKDEIPGQPVIHITTAHVSYYYNIGRTEVEPIPTDPDANVSGIRYRFGAFPVLEPAAIRGYGYMRYRYKDPMTEDNIWFYIPGGRRVLRGRADAQSDANNANLIDPDSYSGFAAKIEDFNYRLLGIKPMLAVVHAANVPAQACEFDNGRTVCPENWEMRQLYIVEATEKPLSWHQEIGTSGLSIPKRILYIDSEGWFITASDQYSKDGALWKTLALFTAYRDQSAIGDKVAIYPFKRIFQTAMVDEDVNNGFSTVSYTPGHDTKEPSGWYINMGVVRPDYLEPFKMQFAGH